MNTFKNYIRETYTTKDELENIAEHICDGVPGMTYNSETGELYKIYREDIWALMCDMADKLDEKNVLSLISNFGGAQYVCDKATFENLLVWAAAEECARQILNKDEEESTEEES